jgi:hypothetical protein
MDKPRIFLSSSKQQEKLLQALTRGLADVAHVEPWTTSFNPGTTALERLFELTREVDFAAFVFARDDWTSASPSASPPPESAQASPRDNVELQITDTQGAPLLDQHGHLPDHDAALQALFAWFQSHRSDTVFDAVGHRVVHGGDRYKEPQRITDTLIATLQQLVPLSPDHLPLALPAIQASRQVYSSIPQVA